MTRKNRPGPKGTSCLTCKRRRKKCDQGVPFCERCEKGGFECLGYEHNSDRRISVTIQPHLVPAKPTEVNDSHSYSKQMELGGEKRILEEPSHLRGWSEATIATTSAPDFLNFVNECSNGETNSSVMQSYHSTAAIVAFTEKSVQTKSAARVLDDSIVKPLSPYSGPEPQLWEYQDDISPHAMQSTHKPTGGPTLSLWKLADLCTRLPSSPPDPLRAFLSDPAFDEYMVAQHGRLVGQWYFKTLSNHRKHFQQWLFSRLQNRLTSFSRWIALIGMGICEAFLTGDTSQHRFHKLWIEHIHGFLKRELYSDTTSSEIQNRRLDWIHVSLLKTVVDQTSHIYQLLQSAAPVFLELVFSDPTFWPNDCDPTYVPLLNVLTLGSRELAFFVLMDCTSSMAFGLPQQIEYDTAVYSRSCSPPHQWAHGSPIEFQVILADINACRDKSPTARNWKEVEHLLLTWQSLPSEDTFTESWMTIACERFAITFSGLSDVLDASPYAIYYQMTHGFSTT
ncbi:unnamed protein product [Rhizoctonia solani]|uniref:Zn(2)-C6 fungal-type domain-containing protein n=1 Tax=Rhizoctonia solani TaxID=456999 RepID=A0A8H2X469_9AGAM|nr:unnamed protein product [Rhizoctonia solani]